MISEHFFHITLTLIPFFAILLLFLRMTPDINLSRIGIFVILAVLISLQSIPLHYIHASHLVGSQTYDCCLPIPVAVNSLFSLDTPLLAPNTPYQLLARTNQAPIIFALNNKSPPLV